MTAVRTTVKTPMAVSAGWESRLGSTVMGFPVTFEVDGVQYFGIPTGRGGGSPWRSFWAW